MLINRVDRIDRMNRIRGAADVLLGRRDRQRSLLLFALARYSRYSENGNAWKFVVEEDD